MRNLSRIPEYIFKNCRRGQDIAKIHAAMWAAMSEHERAMSDRFKAYLIPRAKKVEK